MKKRILSISVAAAALVVAPAHGGFNVIEKPQPAPERPATSRPSSYSLIESGSGASIIPTPRPPAATHVRPAPEPLPARRAATPQDVEPLLSVQRLEAESDRIQAQIERLRADLEIVKVALASARARNGGNMQAVTSRLDDIERRISDTGSSMIRVGFAPNSVRFAPDFTIAQQLLKTARNAVKITIYGHADNSGTPERNAEVAMARAISARNYLQAKGIPAGKIATISRGASEPIAPNDTFEGRNANRRVEIELSSKSALAVSRDR